MTRYPRGVRQRLTGNLLASCLVFCGHGHKSTPLRRLDLPATLPRDTSAVVELGVGELESGGVGELGSVIHLPWSNWEWGSWSVGELECWGA